MVIVAEVSIRIWGKLHLNNRSIVAWYEKRMDLFFVKNKSVPFFDLGGG